jgi:hypothetical protein
MKLILLIFSFLSRNVPQMLHQHSSLNNRQKDVFSGYDQRYLINSTTTEVCYTCNATIVNTQVYIHEKNTTLEKMYNFRKSFAQLALLNYLQRKDESEVNKIAAIENHEKLFNNKPHPYKPNLLAGGLFKDWDFLFEV